MAKRRRLVDEVFNLFAAELTDEALAREVRATKPKGVAESLAVWEVLTQLFNHQTAVAKSFGGTEGRQRSPLHRRPVQSALPCPRIRLH